MPRPETLKVWYPAGPNYHRHGGTCRMSDETAYKVATPAIDKMIAWAG